MKRILFFGCAALLTSMAAAAQDSEVRSRTKVEADDATVVSLTGCLRQDLTGRYALVGSTVAAGEEVTTRTRIETDVDDDDVEITARTRTTVDDPVGTSGRMRTYVLQPRANVALAPHVGKLVQVSAVMLKPGEDDAEVEIKDKTTVDPEGGPDKTTRTETKIEIEDVPHGQYTVVAVKMLEASCR